MKTSVISLLGGLVLAMAQTNLKIPTPTLTKDYHLEVDLDPKINLGVGPGGSTYNWVNFQGGTWTAPWGNGTVVGGGQDYQYILPGLSAQLNTRYLLKTSDEVPAYIQINTNGWRTGPLSVLEALNDPKTSDTVDPSTYKFRLYINMQTNDPRYDHVNTTMWIGSGIRMGAKVIYDAYVVG